MPKYNLENGGGEMRSIKWLVGVLLVLVMLKTVVSAVAIPRQSDIPLKQIGRAHV